MYFGKTTMKEIKKITSRAFLPCLVVLCITSCKDMEVEIPMLCSGGSYSCALSERGTVKCWGDNGNGYLGYGHSNLVIDASVLDDLPLGVQAKTVSVGTNFTCVVTVNDTIRCWGIEGGGRLGKVTSEGTTNDIIPAADATELDILK